MVYFRCLMLSVVITGGAGMCDLPPSLVWPLGVGDGCQEIINNTDAGTLGNVSYTTGYTDVNMSSAMSFAGRSDSFAELNVSYQPALTGDYSIKFYGYFDDTTSGTIFHYRSDAYDGVVNTSVIMETKMTVSNGTIGMEFTDFGSVTFDEIPVVNGKWYNLIFERDVSKDGPELYINATTRVRAYINDTFKYKATSFPGVIRIGNDFDGTNPFSGSFACLQYFACKKAFASTYDSYCATQPTTTMAPTTTSTTEEPTTTTTTMSPTTTSTTEEPTTTTTTMAPTTTSTTEELTTTTTTMAPTTTSTTEEPTTTTTTMAPTTTSTTEEPTTTSTTMEQTTTSTTKEPTTITTTMAPTTTSTKKEPTTTTTTMAPTTTSSTEEQTTATTTNTQTTTTTTEEQTTKTTTKAPTTSSTTQKQTTTTTTMAPTTTSTTEEPSTTTTTKTLTTTTTTEQSTTTSTVQMLFTTDSLDMMYYYEVSNTCLHYIKTESDVTFANMVDIIRTVTVPNLGLCAKYCEMYLLCFSFIAEPKGAGFECKIGIQAPMTSPMLGSMLFELEII